MEWAAREQVFSAQEWSELKQELLLSPRQAEVAERILLGYSDKQIARELEMSVPTVRTHLCRLFSRLDVEDRCGLIVHMYARFREKCQSCPCPRFR
jgi:DNA-binding NarL/FixJ family response regulator